MKSSRLFVLIVSTVTLFHTAAAMAAHLDLNDPRRALGREDDIRVDAELTQDSVASGSAVGVTYQIQNLSSSSIAIADKVCDVTYDNDSRTIVMSVGAEVPKDGAMPKVVTIAPGEKKMFAAGAILHVVTAGTRSPWTAVPQYVQVKVNILRDLTLFRPLIEQQARVTTPISMTDQQFDAWLQSNDTIFLNPIPVHYTGQTPSALGDASQRGAGTRGF